MPYIGKQLSNGNYLKLDDISSSFNSSTTTFSLTNGGSAYYPGSEFSILVSVGGVIQEPESAYQISNDEITFANAPTAQDSFFCIVLGDAIGINVPGNNTVNGTQLAKPLNYDGFFYLDDTDNRVGIHSSSPTVALDVVGDIKLNGSLLTGGGGLTGGILTCTQLDLNGNGDVSGNFVIGGDLTVNGTTTTLDTTLTEVDRIEVGANSNTIVGVAITQSGTADILRLYDGASQVVTVDDEGNVGIAIAVPTEKLHVTGNIKATGTVTGSSFVGGLPITNGAANRIITATSASAIKGNTYATWNGNNLALRGGEGENCTIELASDEGDDNPDFWRVMAQAADNALAIDHYATGSWAEQFRITSAGRVGINEVSPDRDLHISNTTPYIRVESTSANQPATLELYHTRGNGSDKWPVSVATDDAALTFNVASAANGTPAEKVRITSGGIVNIGSNTNSDWISSVVKVRKDQNAVTRVAIRNEDQGSSASSAFAINAYGNSWTLDCGSAAKNSNAFTINVDATSNSNQGTEKFRITSGGQVHIGNSTNNANNNAFFKAHAADGESDDLYVGQFINSEATAGRNYGLNIQAGSNGTDHGFRVKNHAGTVQLLVRGDGLVGINSTTPAAYLDIGAHGTATPTLHVRNHTAAGSFSGNYGSEFRHSFNSANHAMLIHTQEASDARRVLDISDSNGIFATFTNHKLLIGATSSTTLASASTLQVSGSGAATGVSILRTASAGGALQFGAGSSGDNVSDNDALGYLKFLGYHTNGYDEYARINAEVDGTPGDGDAPGALVFSTSKDGVASPAERMRIRPDGAVKIGGNYSSGTNLLHVVDESGNGDALVKIEAEAGADAELLLDTSNGGGARCHVVFQMDGTAKGGIEYANAGADLNDMVFRTNDNSEKVRITSAGSLQVKGGSGIAFSTKEESNDFSGTYAGYHTDNHGNQLIGLNLHLNYNNSNSGTHQVNQTNAHGTIGSAGMFIGGNGSDNNSDICFFSNAQGSSAGATFAQNAYKLRINQSGHIETGTKTITGGNNLAIQNFKVKGAWSGSPAVGKSIELISGYDGSVKMAAIGYNLTDINLGSTYGGDLTFHTQPLYSSPTTPLPVRMRISSSGYVTKSVIPSFYAYSTSDFTHGSTTGDINIYTVTSTAFNEGNCYNTASSGDGGQFVAPVAGRYYFNLTFRHEFQSGYLFVYLKKNGSSMNHAYQYCSQETHDYNRGPGVNLVINLAKGDHIRPTIAVNYAGTTLSAIVFQGYLIG